MNYLTLFAQKERGLKLPQADDVIHIMEIVELAGLGNADAKTIAKKIGFDVRQSSYYRDAAEILGFLDRRKPYHLTDLGRQYLVSEGITREKVMLAALYRFPIMSIVVSCLTSSLVTAVSRQAIEDLASTITKLNRSVIRRRVQTIFSWMEWIQGHGGVIEVDKDLVRLSAQSKLA